MTIPTGGATIAGTYGTLNIHPDGSYTYTRTGSPLTLKLPDEPGQYELRYVMNQGSRILATLPFTVE
mgnify:CR=1 FL=1